jgi:hypothetical protein
MTSFGADGLTLWRKLGDEAQMDVRRKKLIGMAIILAFLPAYAVAAVALGEQVPDHWAVKLVYFVVAGLAWAVPVAPLLTWMNREG